MKWINFRENDFNTLPSDATDVLVSDGIHTDVARYFMVGEYKWVKLNVKEGKIEDFTNFQVRKWKYIN